MKKQEQIERSSVNERIISGLIDYVHYLNNEISYCGMFQGDDSKNVRVSIGKVGDLIEKNKIKLYGCLPIEIRKNVLEGEFQRKNPI
jgi:hypothetical protein